GRGLHRRRGALRRGTGGPQPDRPARHRIEERAARRRHLWKPSGGPDRRRDGQPTAGRFGETVRNLREISPTYQNMVPAGWMLFVDELEKDEALARRFFERVRVLQYGGAALGHGT